MHLDAYLASLEGAETPIEQVQPRQLVRWYDQAADGRCASNGYRYLVGRALAWQAGQVPHGERVAWKTEVGKLMGLSRRSVDLLIQVGRLVHELLSNDRSGNALPRQLFDHPWRELPAVLAAALRGDDEAAEEAEPGPDDDSGSWDTVKWTVWGAQRERQLSEVWDDEPEVQRLAEAYREDTEKLEARAAELAGGAAAAADEDVSDDGTLAPVEREAGQRVEAATDRATAGSARGARRGTRRRRED